MNLEPILRAIATGTPPAVALTARRRPSVSFRESERRRVANAMRRAKRAAKHEEL